MSIQGKVSGWEFNWKSIPRGPSGVALVEVKEKGAKEFRLVELRWRRDADGIWIELAGGVHGYDIQGEAGDDGRPVFSVAERGGEKFWHGLSYLHAGEEQVASGSAGAKKVRVRAQMPGKILRINVQAGAVVEKGQSILVMEAMKMENEIRATQPGTVGQIKVSEGQAVETGADLCVIE